MILSAPRHNALAKRRSLPGEGAAGKMHSPGRHKRGAERCDMFTIYCEMPMHDLDLHAESGLAAEADCGHSRQTGTLVSATGSKPAPALTCQKCSECDDFTVSHVLAPHFDMCNISQSAIIAIITSGPSSDDVGAGVVTLFSSTAACRYTAQICTESFLALHCNQRYRTH